MSVLEATFWSHRVIIQKYRLTVVHSTAGHTRSIRLRDSDNGDTFEFSKRIIEQEKPTNCSLILAQRGVGYIVTTHNTLLPSKQKIGHHMYISTQKLCAFQIFFVHI
jgi:hypothetical protein